MLSDEYPMSDPIQRSTTSPEVGGFLQETILQKVETVL